jgi:hypothetical protein
VDRPPEGACTLAVNDAHLENTFFLTRGEVSWHQFLYLARLKGMQV